MPSTHKSSKKHNSSNVKYVAIQKGLITIIMKFPKKSKYLRKTRHKHIVRGGVSKEANMILEIVRNKDVVSTDPDIIKKRTEISQNPEKYVKQIGSANIVKLYMDKFEGESKNNAPNKEAFVANEKFKMLMDLVKKADVESTQTKDVETKISEELDKLIKMGKITAAKKQSILDTMSNKGIVSTISKSAVNAISRSASAIGNWLTPPNMNINKGPNETNIELLYYPSVHQMDSLNSDSDNQPPPPFGEVILLVNDAYANTYEMFRKKFGSVDDMFKLLIEGAPTNPKNPIPRNVQKLKIIDTEPSANNS